MTGSVPPLLGLHAYEAAARHGSFAAAARELHLSPAAISQRVRTLEAHLGVRLFDRLPRSLRLTEAGQAYLPAVRDVFDDLTAATTGLFGTSGRRRLTVRTQVSYAATWLGPRLTDFNESFPHIDLRVVSAVWSDVLPPDDVDLDIRQGNGSWPGFTSVKLHDDLAVVVCGPGLAGPQGAAPAVGDLFRRPRVQVLGFDDLWRQLERHRGPEVPPEPAAGSITVDTSVTALAIVASSGSWTVVPERFARRAVRERQVLLVGEVAVSMRQHHFLLRPEGPTPPSGEAVVFTRWLRDQDRADEPLVQPASR